MVNLFILCEYQNRSIIADFNNDIFFIFKDIRCHKNSTQRDGFSKYVLFFPGATFLQFSRRVYLFVEQTRFSRRVYLFVEQILIFPGNPYLVLEHIRIFQEPLFSNKQYSFFRKLYLVLEHILFSMRPLCLEQIGTFQVPPSLIGLNGCFRQKDNSTKKRARLYCIHTPYLGNWLIIVTNP